MTGEEIQELERAEYAEAVSQLLEDPNFHRFLVEWLVETDPGPPSPVGESGVASTNFLLGRASLMREFMDGLRVSMPDRYLELIRGVLSYERRRNDADDAGEYGPELGE